MFIKTKLDLNKLFIPNQFWIKKSKYESNHIILICVQQEIIHCVDQINDQQFKIHNEHHDDFAAVIMFDLRRISSSMDIQNV